MRLIALLLLTATSILSQNAVTIVVDAAAPTAPLKPIWAFFAHDEPNYTYMKDGRKLLSELSALSSAPVYMRVHSLCVDDEHGNSYEVWKRMDSPQHPTPDQYAQLVEAGQLKLLESPRWDAGQEGRVHMAFPLPLHGVSLIRLTW